MERFTEKVNILFDLDGTITDPGEGITKSIAHALGVLGVDNPGGLERFIGPPLGDTFEQAFGLRGDDIAYAIAQYRVYFARQGIFENVLYSGMANLLRDLKNAGKRLILATSKPTLYARQILDHFELDGYFSFIAGSEMDGGRSKKGEVIAYALEECAISAFESAVMVGDREHDIIGAQEVGIASIGVLYGYGSWDELTRAGADCIVPSVEALRHSLLK